MTWNHRVMKHVKEDGAEYFAIHEVYYNSAGLPWGWSAEPEPVMEETMEEMRETLQHMTEALDKPVLDYTMEPAPMDLPGDDHDPKAETEW
jgi:hypothetical protein